MNWECHYRTCGRRTSPISPALNHLYYAGSSFGSNNVCDRLWPRARPWTRPARATTGPTGKRSSPPTPPTPTTPSTPPSSGVGGSKWLLFGSFWSGIKLMALNPATGMPAANAKLLSLSETTAPDAEEGAYIVSHGGYYYLFVSAGTCCKGIGSSYQVIVGRSAQITGPYVDPNGTLMTDGGGMELLGSDEGMIGPGSPSVYVGSNGDLIDYHYYDAWDDGDPWIQVRELLWTSTGWPVTARRWCPCQEPLWHRHPEPPPGPGRAGCRPRPGPRSRLLVAAGARPRQGVRRLVLRLELLQPRRRMPAAPGSADPAEEHRF